MSDPGALDLTFGALRVVGYAGYVLLAGTLMFWVLVWPAGSHHRRLVLTSISGSVLLVVATVAEPLLRVLVDGDVASALPRARGAALIIRLAVLAGLAGFLTELLDRPIVGGRRLAAVAVVLLLAATMVVPAGVGSGGLEQVRLAVAGTAHLLGAAVWLGGLAALTVVIVGKREEYRLERVVPRFTKVAALSLLVLVVSGAAVALDVAGDDALGTASSYMAITVAKAVGLWLMTLLAAYGLWYAKDGGVLRSEVAFRRLHTSEQAATDPMVRRLTVVLQVELLVGIGLLVATSALVLVRPGG